MPIPALAEERKRGLIVGFPVNAFKGEKHMPTKTKKKHYVGLADLGSSILHDLLLDHMNGGWGGMGEHRLLEALVTDLHGAAVELENMMAKFNVTKVGELVEAQEKEATAERAVQKLKNQRAKDLMQRALAQGIKSQAGILKFAGKHGVNLRPDFVADQLSVMMETNGRKTPKKG